MKSKVAILIMIVVALLAASSSADMMEEQNIMSTEKGENVISSSALEMVESVLEKTGNRKLVLMMMMSRPQQNCIPTGQPCGALHECCPQNFCDGIFQGKCISNPCIPKGQPCGLLHKCCNGMCPDPFQGTCRQ